MVIFRLVSNQCKGIGCTQNLPVQLPVKLMGGVIQFLMLFEKNKNKKYDIYKERKETKDISVV